jgi:chitinase
MFHDCFFEWVEMTRILNWDSDIQIDGIVYKKNLQNKLTRLLRVLH